MNFHRQYNVLYKHSLLICAIIKDTIEGKYWMSINVYSFFFYLGYQLFGLGHFHKKKLLSYNQCPSFIRILTSENFHTFSLNRQPHNSLHSPNLGKGRQNIQSAREQ